MKQAEQHAAPQLQKILIFVLIILVIFMMVQIQNLQGTAHVVNYAGLVRGATQREVKLEITGHNGAVRYTIGQRKGLGLAMGAPVYVCGKDMQANTVTVGPEEMLFDRIVYADEVNWIAIPELTGPLRVTARTRYHQVEQAATVYPAECGFRLEFDQPQRAPTPGQAVVLYQGDTVLGGGTITRVEK